MKKISKSTIKSIILLCAVIVVFIGSGLYHLNKFETTDEHFWRLERIPQYWQAIKQRNIPDTYINDKPGVSVALISGTGLPFVSQNRSDYASVQDYTMTLNYALRLPILLFNGLVMLPLLFWLLTRAFDRRIASIGIILIGINPILIGISQIINPDALLWSFSAGAIFSFFALLKTDEKKFIILTGILTGFALLSKYTANLLFVFYTMIAGFWLIYEKVKNPNKWLKILLLRYLSIWIVAIFIFILFLPAVVLDIDLFTYGTFFSPPLKPIIIPLLTLLFAITTDAFLFKSHTTLYIANSIKKFKKQILILASIPLLLLILFALINAWTNATFVPLDNLKEVVADTQKLQFPMFEGLPTPIYFTGEIAIQSFNIIFALTPIILIFTITTIVLVFFNKIPPRYNVIIIFCVTVPLIFFAGGLVSETFVNTRYTLMLIPLFSLLASIGISTLTPSKKHLFAFIVLIIFAESISVYFSAPHYFNYQNIFLPKKYILTDSWSYGIFETAQYLNELPNAKDLTIWSDRKAICYYFVGNCIMRRKIDATKNPPDYFVLTRRGVVRHHFKWLNDFDAPYSVDSVYADEILNNPSWKYNILNKEKNYIKIIKTKNISDLSFVKKVKNIQPPTFQNNICNINEFGAKSTLSRYQIDTNDNPQKINIEKNANTKAFTEAVKECSKKGGGTVIVPKGLWYTGKVHLKNNINLHLNRDAIILFSKNPDDFLPVVKTRFVGLELYNYSPMIYAKDVDNVAITGEGTIDGNGKSDIWNTFIGRQKKSIKKLYKMSLNDVPTEKRIFGTIDDAIRPSLIQFYNSQNILIDGVNIIGGPMWTIHPIYSKNIIIQNTNIHTFASNGDGIAIDSDNNVLIQNNTLSTSDDAIVIKSGRDKEGWTINKPSQNIVIQNNAITKAHAGIALGSEMSGRIQNIFVDNIKISNSNRGFRIKTTPGRGGFIKNIILQHLVITNPKQKGALSINMNYGSKTIKPQTKKLPLINNIKINDVSIIYPQNPLQNTILLVDGLKNALSNISFNKITSNNKNATAVIKNSKFLLFKNVDISNYNITDSKDITITSDNCANIQKTNSKRIINNCKN